MSGLLKIDFVGVGAAKSGTTRLARGLQKHPEIFIPEEKELHFFYSGNGLDKYEDFIPNNYSRGKKWFYDKFSGAKKEQKKGEFSVFYLCDSESPELIKKELGDVKIIVMLRDPIKRLLSYHLWRHPTHSVETFSKFIREQNEVVATSLYYEDVEKYINVFGEENVFVGVFEDAMADKKMFFSDVCKFLGVDNKVYPEVLKKKINKTETISESYLKKLFLLVSKVRQALNKIFIFRRFFSLLFSLKVNKLIEKIFFSKKGISKKIKDEDFIYLNNLFKPDVKKLEGLLGKQLKNWL